MHCLKTQQEIHLIYQEVELVVLSGGLSSWDGGNADSKPFTIDTFTALSISDCNIFSSSCQFRTFLVGFDGGLDSTGSAEIWSRHLVFSSNDVGYFKRDCETLLFSGSMASCSSLTLGLMLSNEACMIWVVLAYSQLYAWDLDLENSKHEKRWGSETGRKLQKKAALYHVCQKRT